VRLSHGLRRTVDGEQAQDGRRPQVGALGQRGDQLREDRHQFVVQPLAGGTLVLDQVAAGASQRAQRLHGLVRNAARACPSSQQAARQGVRIDAIGFGAQAQAGGPRRRLMRVEQQHLVARLRQGVIEGLPQAARRFHPDQQRRRLAPLLQPGQNVGMALGGGRNRRALEPPRAAGRLQGTDHRGGLGHVDAHDAADLGGQHATDLLWGLGGTVTTGKLLTSRTRSPSPWALASLRLRGGQGAGVRPSTVRQREAGTGVFPSRSSRKEGRRPFPARCLGRESSRLPTSIQI
jgi:hypothetical protein